MNLVDYILIALIGLILFLAVRKAIRSRGSCSCGGSGSACSGNCAACGLECPSCKKKNRDKEM